jgi:hypothetical protein
MTAPANPCERCARADNLAGDVADLTARLAAETAARVRAEGERDHERVIAADLRGDLRASMQHASARELRDEAALTKALEERDHYRTAAEEEHAQRVANGVRALSAESRADLWQTTSDAHALALDCELSGIPDTMCPPEHPCRRHARARLDAAERETVAARAALDEVRGIVGRLVDLRAKATGGAWGYFLCSGGVVMTGICSDVDGKRVVIADCAPPDFLKHVPDDHRPNMHLIVEAVNAIAALDAATRQEQG